MRLDGRMSVIQYLSESIQICVLFGGYFSTIGFQGTWNDLGDII
jgi:hypothetical protein